MSGLSESKLGIVRQLIEQASDSVVRSLEQALIGSGDYNAASEALYAMVSAERQVRRAQAIVFAPVIAPFVRRERLLPTLQYPTDTLKVLWREMYAAQPQLLSLAVTSAMTAPPDEPSPSYDQVCELGSTMLLDGAAPKTAARIGSAPGGVEQLAQLLRLAPILRSVIPRLDGWLRNLNGDNVASVRLAFKDAVNICDDGGHLLMEIVCAQIQEPWQIIRLISAVMDKPSDRYLASSELAPFGERIMADIADRIDAVKKFDASGGPLVGKQAAGTVALAVTEINEFEQWIQLGRDGGWGQRIFEYKRNLAAVVEGRMKEAEGALNTALPLASKPFGAKSMRAPGKLDADPNPAAVEKAEALLTFIEGVRSSSNSGGFGSFRAKLLEALDERLDHYAEDLIDRLVNDSGRNAPPPARVRAFLDIAARFVTLVRDQKAADIIRRRMASAANAA
jgi:hypothetical protein